MSKYVRLQASDKKGESMKKVHMSHASSDLSDL